MFKPGSKTPVSYLQEQLLLKHKCPKYDLIYNGHQSQPPKFTFRVQVDDISQEGTAKSKQEAKQKAAENMLKALNLIKDEPKEKEEDNEYSMDPLENNYVGMLKEFCFRHCYPDPVYDVEEIAGPPHSRVFKMVCSVSRVHQDGVARTKKAAKHIAAAKMLQQLKECIKDSPPVKEVVLIPEVTLTPEEVSEKYRNVKAMSSSNAPNNFAFYKDHHNAYLTLHEDSPTLARLRNGVESVDNRNSVKLVEDIAKELKVKLSMSQSLRTLSKDKTLVLVSMSLTPAISEIGENYETAAFKLLRTLLILSKLEVPPLPLVA